MSSWGNASGEKRRRFKRSLLRSRGNLCRGCYQRFAPEDLTIDHIVPTSKGGLKTNLSNLQLMCEPCNRKKADT